MGKAHPEWMDDGTRRRGGRQCLFMGGSNRHGPAFAVELQLSCNRATYSKFARAGRFTFPCRRGLHPRFLKHAASEPDERFAERGSIGPAEE